MVIQIANANEGLRFQKAFDCDTRIVVQVRGPQTITFAHEQGAINNPLDGIQFTQVSTNPPYDFVWQGELWYKSDTAGSSFNIEILGKVGGTSQQP